MPTTTIWTSRTGRSRSSTAGSATSLSKGENAEAAGASALIVVNNTPGSPFPMGGAVASQHPVGDDPPGRRQHAEGQRRRLNVTLDNVDPASIPPNRDSDLDAGVIAHEYGHGVSNRLTGGPATWRASATPSRWARAGATTSRSS